MHPEPLRTAPTAWVAGGPRASAAAAVAREPAGDRRHTVVPVEGVSDLAARGLCDEAEEPAQRGRAVERQLRRFLGTTSGRKAGYARRLVSALDPGRIPRPLDRLLAGV